MTTELISDVLDTARRFREAAEMARAMHLVGTLWDDEDTTEEVPELTICPKCLSEVDKLDMRGDRCVFCWDEFNRDYAERPDNFRGER